MDEQHASELKQALLAAQARFRACSRAVALGQGTEEELAAAARAYEDATLGAIAYFAPRQPPKDRGTGAVPPPARTPPPHPGWTPVQVPAAFVAAFAGGAPLNPKRLAFARWLVQTGRLSDSLL
ncbi:MAG TPA: hypothetical protein VFX49_13585 [Chloroflexota bacterium]|nr:hypothetical protein [Chloroflexota bacterium]